MNYRIALEPISILMFLDGDYGDIKQKRDLQKSKGTYKEIEIKWKIIQCANVHTDSYLYDLPAHKTETNQD